MVLLSRESQPRPALELRPCAIGQQAPPLQALVEQVLCLLSPLPFLCAALGNIVSVLGLFFFIYSIVGMNLWGLVKQGKYLTRHANLKHVGMALLTLFRMITGAAHLKPVQPMTVCALGLHACAEVLSLPVPAMSVQGNRGTASCRTAW